MKVLRDHLRDFVALLAILAIGLGVGTYIVINQGLKIPLIHEAAHEVYADFDNVRGVMPGQGQTVRVSGTRVGGVGAVELHEGRARVRLDMDPEYRKLIKRDATILLRPRTGLKDMFLELDPGSDDEPAVRAGGVLPRSATAPDVNPDEILEVLDTDTRSYLKLLLNGAGKGLKGRNTDLREVFYRLGPLHRDLRLLNQEVVKRKRNIRRLITNYGSTMQRLGREDRALSSLVRSSSTVFSRLAEEDERISLAVSRLPSALTETRNTLGKVEDLGEVAGPAFRALRPAVRQIDPANRELRPFAETAEPVLRNRIRPLVRTARPYVRDVRPAARGLAKASPDLRKSFFELNRLFNMAAYNPGGREALTGNLARDRARDEGFLFWLAWVSHSSNLVFSTGDAQGPFRRIALSLTCSSYQQLAAQAGDAAPLVIDALGVQDLLSDPALCPTDP